MSFGSRLMARASALAERAAERELGALARVFESLGRVAVTREAERLVLRGRGLVRRWLTEPALRFVGTRR